MVMGGGGGGGSEGGHRDRVKFGGEDIVMGLGSE